MTINRMIQRKKDGLELMQGSMQMKNDTVIMGGEYCFYKYIFGTNNKEIKEFIKKRISEIEKEKFLLVKTLSEL